jgi:hypothetical protein
MDIYNHGLVPIARVRRPCGPNIYQRAGQGGTSVLAVDAAPKRVGGPT